MWSHKQRYESIHQQVKQSSIKNKLALSLLLLAASCARLLVLGSPPPVAAGQSTWPPAAVVVQQAGQPTTTDNKSRLIEQAQNQIAGQATSQTGAETTAVNSLEQESQIHLESILDLDHLAYLALRNYNLTDERLLQSSWLVGSSAMAIQHSHTRQHKTAEESEDENSAPSPSSDSLVSSGTTSAAEDSKGRLALMLESLIMHLRNGHLRRMSLGELEQVVLALNMTEPFEGLRRRRAQVNALGTNARVINGELNGTSSGRMQENASAPASSEGDGEYRCLHLVTLYKLELHERLRGAGGQTTPVGSSSQSKVEYQESPAAVPSKQERLIWLDEKANGEQAVIDNISAAPMTPEPPGEPTSVSSPDEPRPQVDDIRLMALCKLAINCRSSEDLVELISEPWRLASALNESQSPRRIEPRSTWRRSSTSDNLERDTSEQEHIDQHQPHQQVLDEGGRSFRGGGGRPKSLRDSLSMSLAKLCPLVLFPLHEDEAQCMVRRDDRPPMITVWAFATLFVTIVCFCSLIGLSITPLLGHSPADSSSGGSEASGPVGEGHERLRVGSQSPAHQQQSRRHQHKASLTLFEGLAVGSLVGSALFSLIPQAFELQERESNQGFLLKAFIIFSGIYLFFLSERIMRIILDTRQKRKKKKRLNHRSSTTAAVVDMVHQEHHHQDMHHLRPMHHAHHQQHSQATTFSTSTTTGSLRTRQNSSSVQRLARPSTSSRGSGSKSGLAPASMHRASGNMLQQPDARSHQNISSEKSQSTTQNIRRPAVVVVATQPPIIQQLAEKMGITQRKSVAEVVIDEDQPDQIPEAVRGVDRKSSSTTRRKRQASNARKGQQRKRTSRHLHRHAQRKPLSGQVLPSSTSAVKQRSRQRTNQRAEKTKPHRRGKRRVAAAAISPESDPDDYYHHDDLSSMSSSSRSSSSSSSSFSSYALRGRRIKEGLDMTTRQQTEDSRADYSSSSSPASSLSKCSSCSSFDRDFCGATLNPSDSDEDNDQRRAVSKQISEISRRHAQKQLEAAVSINSPSRTTFKFDDGLTAQMHDVDPMKHMGPIYVNRIKNHARTDGNNQQKQDISTVAWMIILGDGLHNFIDGISIGAAFSESILSGVSISVAVICEEFPHELGDFAVLVSSGMTVRQALGYNFLSACTCYLGMAVGIILGDVNDGASYISALAAGVFLYIALVDMMGELSAALESSSRDSIARTLKLLLLQNVGIAIGISIIFVLSFIDF